ncbi:hypothetical protein C8034_v010751 [Colletotrichum sidae]|uniref:Uncharacterized protein n=1 Tax=Colletotrichum sidae TaxID=1347389 RepID=A0A4R8T127_9PEZI|nr:hypothetical protein C8034_v010751 [Colletotrichum sidae]
MPAPYSDNLYSADDSDVDVDVDVADDDLAAHLSPTDGYFHSTSSSAGDLYPPQQQHQQQVYDFPRDNVTDATLPTSAGVPHVPNVLVQDPSLQKGASSSKDREAREETRLSTDVPLHQSDAIAYDIHVAPPEPVVLYTLRALHRRSSTHTSNSPQEESLFKHSVAVSRPKRSTASLHAITDVAIVVVPNRV